jgi:hypothetical protein
MNHRESKEKHEKSLPIKQTNLHRSCLKTRTEDNHTETVRLSTYRVSFVHQNLNDGKILLTPQSQIDLGEKKRRSDMFMKKAKELQLAEITYFKDHARDKEPIDE